MVVVIQCAATKSPYAGHLCGRDGRRVWFVASLESAPAGDGRLYARPDDSSGTSGVSWRIILREYNQDPGSNPHGLLPAWQLYTNRAYRTLAMRFGLDRLYILSAGWGLIAASFLTPNYDITFSSAKSVEPYKRRNVRQDFHDFCMLPSSVTDPVVFFGGKDYVPLFCDLTADVQGERWVFYAGSKPNAPNCRVQRYRKPFTNWHYQCANAFAEGGIRIGNS